MCDKGFRRGFSLTEVLLAMGTLAIGMVFVAGVFPAGVLFSTHATERTMAALVADEAFAQVRLLSYHKEEGLLEVRVLPSDFRSEPELMGARPGQSVFEFVLRDKRGRAGAAVIDDPHDYAYPLDSGMALEDKRYSWTALCRRTDRDPNSEVQVTVFVCRLVGSGTQFQLRDDTGIYPPRWPRPVPVWVDVVLPGKDRTRLRVVDGNPADMFDDLRMVSDGSMVAEDATGRLYRVVAREYSAARDQWDVLVLDRPWDGPSPGKIWVIPPPWGGGRAPCIAVYQKVIRLPVVR